VCEPVLPNFSVGGTGKATTTSLYHYLRPHPQIALGGPMRKLTEGPLRHIRQQYIMKVASLLNRDPTGWLQ